MNKYELYTLDQLLEVVRNGRADVSKKAADEIRERFKSRRTKGAVDVAIAPVTEEEAQYLAMLELDIRSNSATPLT